MASLRGLYGPYRVSALSLGLLCPDSRSLDRSLYPPIYRCGSILFHSSAPDFNPNLPFLYWSPSCTFRVAGPDDLDWQCPCPPCLLRLALQEQSAAHSRPVRIDLPDEPGLVAGTAGPAGTLCAADMEE
ncbi:hypothetical protein NN561_014608 [Cricetulus griseus]